MTKKKQKKTVVKASPKKVDGTLYPKHVLDSEYAVWEISEQIEIIIHEIESEYNISLEENNSVFDITLNLYDELVDCAGMHAEWKYEGVELPSFEELLKAFEEYGTEGNHLRLLSLEDGQTDKSPYYELTVRVNGYKVEYKQPSLVEQ